MINKIKGYLKQIGVDNHVYHAEALNRIIKENKKDHFLLFDKVCDCFDVSRDEICGRSKRRHIAWARFIIIHEYLKRGYTQEHIGLLVNRTHATVLYARNTVNNMIDTNDAQFRQWYSYWLAYDVSE